MNYPLLGAARGGGYRQRLGTLNDDEARELLKKREIEPMRDERTGRTRFFVLAKRQSAMGRRARIRPECEHVLDVERHQSGVTYSPSHNLRSEIRLSQPSQLSQACGGGCSSSGPVTPQIVDEGRDASGVLQPHRLG